MSTRDERIASIPKALAIIEAFSRETPSLTISEAARRTGTTRASARRILLTLEGLGYAGTEQGRFYLRPSILRLGFAYLSSSPVRDAATSYLEGLAERFEESCSVAVLDADEIVYVARMPARRIMTITLAVGARLPAYCTSLGRVLLASLTPDDLDQYFERVKPTRLTEYTVTKPAELRRLIARAQQNGYAVVDQEREVGVRSVAVPLLDASGRTAAAINISAHASRVSMKALESTYLTALRDAADQISARLI